MTTDLDRAEQQAWDDLADAELEHDQTHAEHAIAELDRLHALIPTQRTE